MIPAHFKIVFDPSAIADAIARLSPDITSWANQVRAQYSQDIVVLPVLRGGLFFAADLVRALGVSVEVEPIWTKAYSSSTNSQQLRDVSVDLGTLNLSSKSVLIVDEICDTGRTLEKLSQRLIQAGATQVKSAVLIKRLMEHQTFQPDWVAFEYKGPEWFVGYGLEDSGRFRNLPAVYKIQSTSSEHEQ